MAQGVIKGYPGWEGRKEFDRTLKQHPWQPLETQLVVEKVQVF